MKAIKNIAMDQFATLREINGAIDDAETLVKKLRSWRWNHAESKALRVAQFTNFVRSNFPNIDVPADIRDVYCVTDRRDCYGNKETLCRVSLTIEMPTLQTQCRCKDISDNELKNHREDIWNIADSTEPFTPLDFMHRSSCNVTSAVEQLFCALLVFLFPGSSFEPPSQRERDFEWVYCWQ